MDDNLPVVGTFARKPEADRALRELREGGFEEAHLGYLARGEGPASVEHRPDDLSVGEGVAEGAAVGAATGGVVGTALGIATVAGLVPPFGTAIAGGALVALIVGGSATAMGGLVGYLMGQGFSEQEAMSYEEHFRSGRVIVTVHAGGRRALAEEVLRRHGASVGDRVTG
jgi:hypothetical protein